MKRSKFTDEQILAIVREGEAGRKVADLVRTHGITEQTYYRWKAKYGGMELSEMQRLKQLEDENRRLKQIVAEQTLDLQALKAVGIEARVQLMDWKQWMQGPFRGDFDLTLINHVEPLDYAIYTDPGYYFGYDSAAFCVLVQRHGASTRPRERQRLFADLQRHLATDAASAWLFAPQISTVARKGLQGLWMNYPIFAHDLAALSWQ